MYFHEGEIPEVRIHTYSWVHMYLHIGMISGILSLYSRTESKIE